MSGFKVFIASALGTIAGIIAIVYVDSKLEAKKAQVEPKREEEET
jgi:hypothetical protein